MQPTRAEIIRAIPPVPDSESGQRALPLNEIEHLRELTGEPIYAIPTDLLDLLEERKQKWFGPGELELERKLTHLCNAFRAVAIFLGQFVQHQFFFRPKMPIITDDMIRKLDWEESPTAASIECGLNKIESVIAQVSHRREAYLGWLMTYPGFVAERNALRAKWRDTVERLGSLPPLRVRASLEYRGLLPAVPGSDMACLADDFEAFHKRWDLLGLSTWDLPQAKLGNFGCAATFDKLCGVEDSPTVQLPRTLRLPARFPVNDLLSGKMDDHLGEWQAVLDQRHPDKMNYVRLQRVFHLHFLRNVVLASGYHARFCRRVEMLDEVFAAYFDDQDEESVRKLRQWTDRRLRP